MKLFEIYLSITLMMTPLDESWNYMNPYPYRMKRYVIINWYRDDFHYWRDGTWALKQESDNDSKLKAKARRQWHERQVK